MEYTTVDQHIAMIKLLLASPRIKEVMVGNAPVQLSATGYNHRANKHIIRKLIEAKRTQSDYRLTQLPHGPKDAQPIVIYRSRPNIPPSQERVTILRSEQISSLTEITPHVSISRIDDMAAFSKSPRLKSLKSLDLSRLNLTDDQLVTFAALARMPNLRWLSLAGNPNISIAGVRRLCQAIEDGRIADPGWLDLTGTACEAHPYLDGAYWRITTAAHNLGRSIGYQRWMMLGARQHQLEGLEYLSESQRMAIGKRFSQA